MDAPKATTPRCPRNAVSVKLIIVWAIFPNIMGSAMLQISLLVICAFISAPKIQKISMGSLHQLPPAIHRGQQVPLQYPVGDGSAHGRTNLLHRGHYFLLQASARMGTAHGELQELSVGSRSEQGEVYQQPNLLISLCRSSRNMAPWPPSIWE